MGGVTITELIDKMGLRNMTPELETDNVMLVHADVNRPALQLTGFFDHFDKDRVQIIGYVENAYISTLTPQRRREMFDKLLSSGIPCLVYSRGMAPEEEVLELCNHYGVPCMVSEKTTSDLMAEIIRWLNVKMAPMISTSTAAATPTIMETRVPIITRTMMSRPLRSVPKTCGKTNSPSSIFGSS